MMFYDFYPFLIPEFNYINEKPPTLYAFMNSIVNFDKADNEKVKIKDLPYAAAPTIFNFEFPLSNVITKADFECEILKHYMMRRIGFDTLTAFQIALDAKLNEIMPMYNKLFDALEGWDIFNGETEKLTGTDVRNITSSTTNESNGTTVDSSKYSDTPQNNITDIQNGNYLTNYTYDDGTNHNKIDGSGTSTDTNNISHTTEKSVADKIQAFKEFKENREAIFTMIFKDLDVLFYSVI